MNICVFITTRYGSTRLPGKSLLQVPSRAGRLGGSTVTDILVGRVKAAGYPVCMVTPDTPEDTQYMVPIAKKHMIGYYQGEVTNIIQRHIDCAHEKGVDWVINVDGDDILACPDLIFQLAEVIEGGKSHDCIQIQGYPLGLGLLAYSLKRLINTRDYFFYEGDTNWGAKVVGAGQVTELEGHQFKKCRLTLDYMPDMVVVNHVIKELGPMADSEEICNFMGNHPEICHINNYLNEQYFKRLEDLSANPAKGGSLNENSNSAV